MSKNSPYPPQDEEDFSQNPGLEKLRAVAWAHHTRTWGHCLRCKLSNARLDPESGAKGKDWRKQSQCVPMGLKISKGLRFSEPPPLPVEVLLMLSVPDTTQEYHGHLIGGPSTKPGEWELPPTLQAIWNLWRKCKKSDPPPFELKDLGIITALGCRPVNFQDRTKLQSPSGEMLTACRPRWQTEVLFFDPRLIVVTGHHAFASVSRAMHGKWVNPSFEDSTKTGYQKSIGEIFTIPLPLPDGSGAVLYPVYVAPDVTQTIIDAKEDQWASEFSYCPCENPVENPVAHFRWHLWRALWIGKALSLGQKAQQLFAQDSWRDMVLANCAQHDSKASVQDLVASAFADLEGIAAQETSDSDVRSFIPPKKAKGPVEKGPLDQGPDAVSKRVKLDTHKKQRDKK